MKLGLGLPLGRPNQGQFNLTPYSWAAEFDAFRRGAMYQGVSQSTPVTADSQSVGRWENRGSGGAQLLQATANARPTYYSALFNSAYPGVKFVTDDWMSCDFGSNLWTDGEHWLVFLSVLPDILSGTQQAYGFDEAPLSSGTPDRWGNSDVQALTDRMDIYGQTNVRVQFDNRPLTQPVVWSVVVGPSGANNITAKYLTTSAGSITSGTATQTVANGLRMIMLGARHSGADTVDRIMGEMDVNYFAVMDYTNFPGAAAEELYMRELLTRIGL